MAAFGKSLSFSGGASGLGGTQAAGTTGGSLFGGFNQQANSTGGSLFGASNDKRQRSGTATDLGQAGQTAGAGGLFGNNAQNAQATGNSTTSQVGGGLFGSTTTAGAAGGGGIFGSGSGFSTAKPATSSLFGSAPAGGIFGGGNTTQQQQQQPVQQPAPQQQQQQQQQQISEAEELSRQFLMIKECWDPASPYYQFRHYFYNVVEPEQLQMYQCPAGQDPALWQQAQNDNPDPLTLVPVVANGFDDLRKRVDSQSLQMQSYQERTAEVSDKLCAILQKHHSETTVRLTECRRRQAELSQRLLEFMKLLQLLRLRGQLLHPEEEVFRIRVEHLEKEMTRSGSLKQRLAELQDLTYRLQANARRRREMLGLSGNGTAVDGFEVADETQLESVMKMLSEKQRGLAHLTQVVSQDAQSLEQVEDAIEERFVEVQKQREARERAQVAKSFVLPW
ncbi:Nucleoporin nup57 [Coemansia sp. RSA 1722]|nr:Nucleoporin nup57 [Coemansia sp. RSA 485]KAJ2600065.1 Nucleoporin nup57 [Coemansia sp. RSA 1722]